jgi:general stress protein 26
METERLLDLARKLIGELTFCVAVTQGEGGDANARIVQPRPLGPDWSVDVITNRRCRKVREIERTGRMTLLYQHDAERSYVCLVGRAEIVEDVELKRAIWTPAHNRWNPGGPEDPATVFARLTTERIELWSAVHGVLPEPQGYSAALLERDGAGWRYSTT